MSQLLREKQRNDGITELTVDLDGVRTVIISVLTAVRADLSDQDILTMARIQAEKSRVPKGPL